MLLNTLTPYRIGRPCYFFIGGYFIFNFIGEALRNLGNFVKDSSLYTEIWTQVHVLSKFMFFLLYRKDSTVTEGRGTFFQTLLSAL